MWTGKVWRSIRTYTRGRGLVLYWWMIGLLAGLGAFQELTEGKTDQFADHAARGLLCVGFILWAYVYYRVNKTNLGKMFLGAMQVFIALASDWYQLGKIAKVGLHNDNLDRWTFIAAAILVIAHGFKDFNEGYEANRKVKEDAAADLERRRRLVREMMQGN